MAADPVTRRPEGGFTMIEVMIAITLTALAILGIMALYATETKASTLTRHSTEAAVLAEDRVEELRVGSSGAVALTSELNLNEEGSNAPAGIYTRTYQMTPNAAGFDDITVTVSWNDNGTSHQVLVHARRNQ
jgi:Tfp pilus assembly protein PilV